MMAGLFKILPSFRTEATKLSAERMATCRRKILDLIMLWEYWKGNPIWGGKRVVIF